MTATDQGEAVLAHAVAAYAEALGSRLVAGYALGSLAHGGFSPLVSDVDLGLILADPLRASDRTGIRRVAGAVKAGGPALHERLSVFWARRLRWPARRAAAGSPRSTGWTCSTTAACSPGATLATAWPARGRPSCS